jgi:competence protein ComEA
MQSVKKSWLKDYFTFSAKERRAVIILGAGAVLFALLPGFFPFLVEEQSVPEPEPALEQQFQVAAAQTTNASEADNELFEPKSVSTGERDGSFSGTLFYFDPNTATAADWKKLGVKEKTVQSISKYLSKGGKFRKPDDLRKMYTLSPAVADRLIPYVRIAVTPSELKREQRETSFPEKKAAPSSVLKIDINQADAEAWQQLRGIGPAYARRIINFRDKLGGFRNVDQVAETFGLPDSTFQQIKPFLQADERLVRKINLNTATLEELKAHPYIDNRTARNIIAYREQHGPFQRVDVLLRIGSIDEDLYARISPYLAIE